EAMAMGTPLLAGNNIGYANVMKGHGRIGLVDPLATKDFSNRMAVFLSDSGERKLMTDWGLKEVKKYDYPVVVSQYEAAYREAIRHKNRKASKSANESDEKKPRLVRRLFVRRHA